MKPIIALFWSAQVKKQLYVMQQTVTECKRKQNKQYTDILYPFLNFYSMVLSAKKNNSTSLNSPLCVCVCVCVYVFLLYGCVKHTLYIYCLWAGELNERSVKTRVPRRHCRGKIMLSVPYITHHSLQNNLTLRKQYNNLGLQPLSNLTVSL